MSKQREALQMALKAIESGGAVEDMMAAEKAIQEALAEPEQEPVAWMCSDESMTHKGYSRFARNKNQLWNIPVYISPPTRKPLTDAEIDAEFTRECYVSVTFADGTQGIALDKVTARDFARAIERAIWENNNG
jgi:hypothetical protein